MAIEAYHDRIRESVVARLRPQRAPRLPCRPGRGDGGPGHAGPRETDRPLPGRRRYRTRPRATPVGAAARAVRGPGLRTRRAPVSHRARAFAVRRIGSARHPPQARGGARQRRSQPKRGRPRIWSWRRQRGRAGRGRGAAPARGGTAPARRPSRGRDRGHPGRARQRRLEPAAQSAVGPRPPVAPPPAGPRAGPALPTPERGGDFQPRSGPHRLVLVGGDRTRLRRPRPGRPPSGPSPSVGPRRRRALPHRARPRARGRVFLHGGGPHARPDRERW